MSIIKKTAQNNQDSMKQLIAEELLDIVDHNNKVIGQARRQDIHALGLRHRSAHVLIYNQQGDLFLQKRSKHKDDFPGYWDSSAAGHVDAGESYDQCIVRETKEELGVELTPPPIMQFLLTARPENGMEFCQVYTATHNGPFELDHDEVETGDWFSPEQITNWLASGGEGMTPSIKIMILKLKLNFKNDS